MFLHGLLAVFRKYVLNARQPFSVSNDPIFYGIAIPLKAKSTFYYEPNGHVRIIRWGKRLTEVATVALCVGVYNYPLGCSSFCPEDRR